MDRERLFRHLEQRYSTKREMLSRIPLGMQPDALWQELLSRRRAKSTVLPFYSCLGMPYWYVTTERMVTASEKIVGTLLENEAEYDPYTDAPPVATLEECFFTSFVDGSGMTLQEAMDFLQHGGPPRDMEEQLIVNNRQAAAYATSNLYHPLDDEYLRELNSILTDGLDGSPGAYRQEDWIPIFSMQDERFSLPPARMIPDRLREVIALTENPGIHPLIKAAVAQAGMLVIRPFPEGNERLGRMLSMIVLIRSGYGYFSDVSLSALIARKSYGYYEAISSILREENGSDLTYFLEYFLDILADAVDEREARKQRRTEENLQAELELARTPLSMIPEEDSGESIPVEAPTEETPAPSAPVAEEVPLAAQKAAVIDQLLQFAEENGSTIMGRTAAKLVGYIDCGKYEFTTGDLRKDFGLTQKPRSLLAIMLKDTGIVEIIGMEGRFYKYRFAGLGESNSADNIETEPPPRQAAKPSEIAPPTHPSKKLVPNPDEVEVLSSKSEPAQRRQVKSALKAYAANNGNNVYTRIAGKLTGYIDAGKLTFTSEDFTQDFGIDRKKRVMVAIHLQKAGLIVPVDTEGRFYVYAFRLQTPSAAGKQPLLADEEPEEDENLNDEPELDLNGFFVRTPAPLTEKDYSPELIRKIRSLAESKLSRRDKRMGTMLLDCLSKGVITSEAYKGKINSGYWASDMRLAEQIGLVARIDENNYRILRDLDQSLPRLDASQKAQITRIFNTFGEEEFSQDMVISSFDYSRNHASALLHNFTLIGILECLKAENGAGTWMYRIRVTPEKHPECFVKAA